uniref:Zinc finger CCCH-type containing 7Ba n=1 Tax=Cyclopterus lumpus TaxID=8103 RepID=A0A8C2YZK9_CYCLU
MDPARQKRKEEIRNSLTFIQRISEYTLFMTGPKNFLGHTSSFFPPPQDFLAQLVCNLLDEGNASFRDGDWEQAVREFSEGLNVSHYAAAEEIQIPEALLESLHVYRAAAYHSMGEYERGVTDCDIALKVCKESRGALYRKALCLKELRKYKEAYNCTTDCLLVTRMDKQVNELAQELAVHLGLKNRKPYVGMKVSQGVYTFVHKPDLVHSCQRDILLCRLESGYPSEWTRVRRIPNWSSFSGPFVLCRELLKSGDLGLCKFGENCTFAYNQLEIDVWTEERKGRLDRNLLFDTSGLKLDPVNSIIRLLREDKGMFMFLCQECFDGKPRIIRQRCRDDHTVCSNLDARHTFDANKCLVFVVQTLSVKYKKVRPLSVLCHLDLCRQAIRYGCLREDSCYFAHSVIELKTWRVQRDTGISPDEIVKQLSSGGNGSKPRGEGGEGGGGKSLNMKMKFSCAQCLRDGLIREPDKALKHCTAKARHTWTKERWVLLVKSLERKKWVQVRPLPHAKNFPVHYDICTQILKRGKCNFSGNCTFAHSQEEREMWMYMKNNDLREMQQIYDMWLSLTAHNRQADGAMLTQPVPEERCIVMPTDYAEPMNGFHCRLCGKHSNGERQWQQHISTEKHKDRVFSCEGEDEALTWSYRFPVSIWFFKMLLFDRSDGGCPDGVSCDYAHSVEELQEWTERRDFLRQKLAKAREDMLIMPDEHDFGKFNFLLQD